MSKHVIGTLRSWKGTGQRRGGADRRQWHAKASTAAPVASAAAQWASTMGPKAHVAAATVGSSARDTRSITAAVVAGR